MARKFFNGIDVQAQRIINLGSPSVTTDAVNKQYVDNLVNGLSWHTAARVASTANVTITAPGATIDGVTLANGDRVLLKNQSTASQNGIYVFNGSGSALTLATDGQQGEFGPNSTFFVSEGTVNADTAWTVTTNGPITVGTTSIAFAQFGGGVSYTAGNGLTLSGNQFAVVPGPGILADGTNTRVDTTVVTRKYAATIGDGTTTSFTVTHSLGTTDVVVAATLVATGEVISPDIYNASNTTVTIVFAVAPATSTVRVIVHG